MAIDTYLEQYRVLLTKRAEAEIEIEMFNKSLELRAMFPVPDRVSRHRACHPLRTFSRLFRCSF